MMSGENKVSWTVKDLIPNGEYYFRVQAVNKIGGGEFIELRNPVIAEDQKRKKKLAGKHVFLLFYRPESQQKSTKPTQVR